MSELGRIFEEHRSFLWGVAYRLTGNAADADDVVQGAFVRALERPPARTDLPWRPWLVRVAVNLGRDQLRRRRRRRYDGPWLPSPIETPEPPSPEPADPAPGPLARYALVESLSYAFLVALERLTPTQRAVLLLRDVFDYSAREVADALAMGEAAVRQSHRRARRQMARYDAGRPTAARPDAAVEQTLQRFLTAVSAGDAVAVESMLCEDVRHVADGGGEYATARVPIEGRDRVARLFLGLGARLTTVPRVSTRRLNGQAALVLDFPEPLPGAAPRLVLQLRLAPDGRIGEIFVVVASRKLTRLA